MIAGSFGFLASNNSATLGRPPVMSLVLEDSLGILAKTWPAYTLEPSSTLKIVSGQKIVLNNDDKVLVYGSAATLDVVASILEDVT